MRPVLIAVPASERNRLKDVRRGRMSRIGSSGRILQHDAWHLAANRMVQALGRGIGPGGRGRLRH